MIKYKKFKQHLIYKIGLTKILKKQIWKCKNCDVETINVKVFHLNCNK